VGADQEALEYLKQGLEMTDDECSALVTEALIFLGKDEVQRQVDPSPRRYLIAEAES
jgi:hypothetical protein